MIGSRVDLEVNRDRAEVMTTLVTGVIAAAGATSVTVVVLRSPVIMCRMLVHRRRSHMLRLLHAPERVQHGRQPLERDQQEQGEQHVFTNSAKHRGQSKVAAHKNQDERPFPGGFVPRSSQRGHGIALAGRPSSPEWYTSRPFPPRISPFPMTTIDTQVIRAEPHAEIGALIQCSVDTLVEQWCVRALAEQSVARQVHHSALRDHLPKFLRGIGQALSQSGTGGTPQHRLHALEHGEERWQHGWSLAELVRDYQLLRLVILEYLEKSLLRPLHTRETMAVGVFIDDAIAASIGAYVAKRDEEASTFETDRVHTLEQTNRRKDEFMAVLAHELRNPLAPIADSVKILRALLPSPQARVGATIDVIDRQSQQLIRLVDDILDVARIGLGRLELRKSRFDLATVLREAAQASMPAFKAKKHDLTLSVPVAPLYLEADLERLIQVVCNLLNNAAKYTPEGGRIHLIGEQDGESAVIRVRDNGIGIAPEMLTRVFDMFTQAEESRDYSQGGLGIGLTLVRRLVEQHGGAVTCQSEGPGRGSEFVVHLPAVPQNALQIVQYPPKT